MEKEKQTKELEITLTTYIAMEHNQDECSGFIDGFKEAMKVINKDSDISHSIIGRYCQKLDKYSEENQMKYQSKTNDQERSITAGMILATKKIANELRGLIND